MKPILYLDIDGVCVTFIRLTQHGPALGLKSFMNFVLQHYEVRWCTTWATSGTMSPTRLEDLAKITGLPVEVWTQVGSSLPWVDLKTKAIDWDEVDNGRTFIWIEDGLLDEELEVLIDRGIEDWYIYTDVFKDQKALIHTLYELVERLPKGT